MRARGRSKLNLSISTGSEGPSAESSPSTLSTISSPSTPSSPVSTFSPFPTHTYAASADGHSGERSVEEDEDSLAIGRVLTPEADPFAKGDIAIPAQCTPRPPSCLLSRKHSMQYSPYSANNTVTWNASPGRSRTKTRNSLPASPVSTAYTFPSSCSLYTEDSPGRGPPTPMWTRKHQGPPSAWSLLTPPGTPPSASARSASSPKRTPPSMLRSQSQSQRGMMSSPSKRLVFPLPPSSIPHSRLPPSLPPPDRPLPEPPMCSTAPPVPPKDPYSRIARAHKSLPASPEVPRSGGMTRHRREVSDDHPRSAIPVGSSLDRCTLDTLALFQERPNAAAAGVCGTPSGSSLGEPWSEHAPDGPSRSVTPMMHIRTGMSPANANRRRSADSISTVTASSSSSVLHDVDVGAAGRWDPGRDTSPIVEGDSFSIDSTSMSPALSPSLSSYASPALSLSPSPPSALAAEGPRAALGDRRGGRGGGGVEPSDHLVDRVLLGVLEPKRGRRLALFARLHHGPWGGGAAAVVRGPLAGCLPRAHGLAKGEGG